eukprot:scaffold23104_cov27-Tisochrysis_lutea.AAC.1
MACRRHECEGREWPGIGHYDRIRHLSHQVASRKASINLTRAKDQSLTRAAMQVRLDRQPPPFNRHVSWRAARSTVYYWAGHSRFLTTIFHLGSFAVRPH